MTDQLPVWEKLAKEIIWQQLGDIKNKTILDFGSGSGITADHYAANNFVTAIEPSREMICFNSNNYKQIIGSSEELKRLESASFDIVICHNVLEYVHDRDEVVREFYRVLKPGGKLSIVKHNRAGRVMQMVVLLNNFDEADNLLQGHNSSAQKFGEINYYEDCDILNWHSGFSLIKSMGLRTFWDLQQNQEIQKELNWQNKMIAIEQKVSEIPQFREIAFFHHLLFEKGK